MSDKEKNAYEANVIHPSIPEWNHDGVFPDTLECRGNAVFDRRPRGTEVKKARNKAKRAGIEIPKKIEGNICHLHTFNNLVLKFLELQEYARDGVDSGMVDPDESDKQLLVMVRRIAFQLSCDVFGQERCHDEFAERFTSRFKSLLPATVGQKLSANAVSEKLGVNVPDEVLRFHSVAAKWLELMNQVKETIHR